MSRSDSPTVVLVQGGFADGSAWQGVYEHPEVHLPAHPCRRFLPPQNGFLFLDREKFHASFAGRPER